MAGNSKPNPKKTQGIRNSQRSNGKAWKQDWQNNPPTEQSDEDSQATAMRKRTMRRK